MQLVIKENLSSGVWDKEEILIFSHLCDKQLEKQLKYSGETLITIRAKY